ncbi:HAD hydrolase family protein [Endozoicomonas sp. SM1973]|uniref:HAD hydrolase family protein n=1 Tax=Spartinivicinus marinus TaxID=2994442 RepID=A0A853HVV7_9GAMM|nr:HAD family hydrolase [Spartinivicinus marinus]MCX4029023.1 HAD hydrolase family protein [Spartinivicinus marinus]NYZ65393.1 HAD hydrolase family protein [Spartinivicinus marinus]
MSLVVFTDIDDTLMQTERKCSVSDKLHPGAVDRDGQVISFYTEKQHRLINLLGDGKLIPVTGRNNAALCRTRFSFNHEIVINHGALVLNHDRTIDNGWLQIIELMLVQWQELLAEWTRQVQAIIDQQQLPLRAKVITDFDISCYVSIKVDNHVNKIEDFYSLLEPIINEVNGLEEARVHINGRNMALLPPYASKAKAVNYLKQKYQMLDEHTLFVGAGDSLSDIEFMKACDYLVVPQNCQITEQAL